MFLLVYTECKIQVLEKVRNIIKNSPYRLRLATARIEVYMFVFLPVL